MEEKEGEGKSSFHPARRAGRLRADLPEEKGGKEEEEAGVFARCCS